MSFDFCRKTLTIVCGGTFVMTQKPNRGLDLDNETITRDTIENLVRQLKIQDVVDIEYPFSLDSTDISPEHWSVLAKTIATKKSDYEAVIIVCGTNTLSYVASALSFALQGIEIPVIITGAQLPIFKLYSDAQNNFVNSLRVAKLSLSGIFVVFGNQIILGCRSKKVSDSDLNAFESFNVAPLGTIGININIDDNEYAAIPRPKEFLPRCQFCSAVASITVLPGIRSSLLETLMDDGYRGIILRSFGSGDLPQHLFKALECARDKEIPVINTTQCRGTTSMGLNEVGRRALDFGLIQAYDMSMEAMSTKLMWLLGQKTPYLSITKQMHTNMIGEINVSGGTS